MKYIEYEKDGEILVVPVENAGELLSEAHSTITSYTKSHHSQNSLIKVLSKNLSDSEDAARKLENQISFLETLLVYTFCVIIFFAINAIF